MGENSQQLSPPERGISSGEQNENLSFFKKKPTSFHTALFLLAYGLLLTIITMGLILQSQTPPSPPPIAPKPQTKPLILSLETPAEGQLLTEEEILVKGKTLPNLPVIFFTETDANSTESDNLGNFEGKIKLNEGINTLTVTVFNEKGEEKSSTLTLVYNQQVLGTKTPPETPGQIKKTIVSSPPPVKALIGNLKEITPNSLTIEKHEKPEKIKTILDKGTKIIDQNKKPLKPTSLKINDLVAIIATESGEFATSSGEPKKAVKVFVKEATESAQMKRRAVQGVISNITESIITLTHQIQTKRTYSLLINEQTIIVIKGVTPATPTDLKVGQRIAAVGDLTETGILVAKRIHVIPGKAVGVFKKYHPIIPSAAIITPTASVSPTISLPSPEGEISSPIKEVTPTETPLPTIVPPQQ